MSKENKAKNAITEDMMEKMLDRKLKPIGEKMESLVKSVEFISEKYDELLKKQQCMEEINKKLLEENNLLKSQVFNLGNQSKQFAETVNELEQYGRRDCLEVRGIPVQEGENTDDLVCSVASLVNVNINAEDISVSHRLSSNRTTSSNQPPVIIAKFVRRCVKDKIYQAKKYLKGKTTQDLRPGSLPYSKIYISESLTRKNKELFDKCLEKKKSLNYKFIWTV